MKTATLYQSTCCSYLYSIFYRNDWKGDLFASEIKEVLTAQGFSHYIIDNAFTGRSKRKETEKA